MTLFFAICLGIGLALGVDFEGTDLSFLEDPWFLLALLAGVIVLVIAERRIGPERVEGGPIGAAVTGISLGLGALLFAGALGDDGYTVWPGLIGGLACAALAQTVGRVFFGRIRARLDPDAARALPVYADVAGLVVAGLSVLLPPLSLLALAFLIWLLIGQRRREGSKYAGLRVLR